MRQDSLDKSLDSKEASPQSKEASPRAKRWSGDTAHQLSLQQRDSLDSQSDQKQSDSGKESEVPPSVSEPVLLDHSKTSLSESKQSGWTMSSDAPEPPLTESEQQSTISPTLKLAHVLTTDPGGGDVGGADLPLNDDDLFEMLEKSSDGLPENMLENQSPNTSHDTSSNVHDDSMESNPTSDEHHEYMLSPIVEGSVHSSSGRQSPVLQDYFDTTITESLVIEGREEEDGLEALAALDKVLDKENVESDDEDADESNFKPSGPVGGGEVGESEDVDQPKEGVEHSVDKAVER